MNGSSRRRCFSEGETPSISNENGFPGAGSSDQSEVGGFTSTVKAKRSSKFNGVHFDKIMKMWRIYLTVPGLAKLRDVFADEIEAAKYYDELVNYFFKIKSWDPS